MSSFKLPGTELRRGFRTRKSMTSVISEGRGRTS
jgi:hypothetical protein